ncbi:hypothetical protein K4G60_g5506 [Candida parapsilosis]|nr:hypothetical protein K4G60_g5506 [Candida parapsilosis]KAI5911791.1 hypothetical protein K4G61_g5495 [Candida parapsilosis]
MSSSFPFNDKKGTGRFEARLEIVRSHCTYMPGSQTEFKIPQKLNTILLRELYITLRGAMGYIFADYQLSNDFPNLILLGMTSCSKNNPVETCRNNTDSKHRELKFLTIRAASVSDSVARKVCELALQFPKASINWWGSCSGKYKQVFFVEQQYKFSPIMPLASIALQ